MSGPPMHDTATVMPPHIRDAAMLAPPNLMESHGYSQATKRQRVTETSDNDCIKLRFTPNGHLEVNFQSRNNGVGQQDLLFALAPDLGYGPVYCTRGHALRQASETTIVTVAKLNEIIRAAAHAAMLSNDYTAYVAHSAANAGLPMEDDPARQRAWWQCPMLCAELAQFKGVSADTHKNAGRGSIDIHVTRTATCNNVFYARRQGEERVNFRGHEECVMMFSRERMVHTTPVGVPLEIDFVLVTPLAITDYRTRRQVYGHGTRLEQLRLCETTYENVADFAKDPVPVGDYRTVVYRTIGRLREGTHSTATAGNVLRTSLDHTCSDRFARNCRISLGLS